MIARWLVERETFASRVRGRDRSLLFSCCVLCVVLCCVVLYCGVLWCGVLCCVVLWCGVLCCGVVCCVVLCCVVVCCMLLLCVGVCVVVVVVVEVVVVVVVVVVVLTVCNTGVCPATRTLAPNEKQGTNPSFPNLTTNSHQQSQRAVRQSAANKWKSCGCLVEDAPSTTATHSQHVQRTRSHER